MAQNIPVDFGLLRNNYPHRKTRQEAFGGELRNADLQKFMASIPGTPCCVQVSHAFNLSGHPIPPFWEERRRNPSPIMVDEMEKYMTGRYGPGELPMTDANRKRRKAREIKAYLKGRKGLLVMNAHTRPTTPNYGTANIWSSREWRSITCWNCHA